MNIKNKALVAENERLKKANEGLNGNLVPHLSGIKVVTTTFLPEGAFYCHPETLLCPKILSDELINTVLKGANAGQKEDGHD